MGTRMDTCAAGGPMDELEWSESAELIELARDAGSGNSAAMSKLLRMVAPKLIAIVRAILGGGPPDIDDAVQQTLIGFVQGLPSFRGDCSPTGYGRVIAVRTAVAIRKRARLEKARHESCAADAMLSVRPTPSEDAQASRRKNALRE